MLTKVTYPTGGYDEFDYEAPDYGKDANHVTTVFYTETLQFKSRTDAAHDDLVVNEEFTLDQAYSAEISMGGRCGFCKNEIRFYRLLG